MKVYRNNQGFTLIELLLVIGIVAIILAVIVPMGIRANIDAKYGTVRQNCSELASFASKWAEKSALAQDERLSTATIKNYFATLAGQPAGGELPTTGALPGQWIAIQTANNWNLIDGSKENRQPIQVPGRIMDGTAAPPEDTVEDIVPPDKTIRNPFTEVNVFRSPNLPIENRPVTGAIACGAAFESEGDWLYFALAFQGTDSTTAPAENIASGEEETTFHAGMGLGNIGKLRNAVFMGRYR